MGTVLIILAALVLVLFAARALSRSKWEKSIPPTPTFARPKGRSTSLRTTLRRDTNALIEKDEWVYLWGRVKRYWFVGTGCPPQKLSSERYETLRTDHDAGPVLVAAFEDRQFWWWGDDFYWDNGDYTADDVRAVVLEQKRRNQKQLERAHSVVAVGESGNNAKRQPISEEVRRLVWRRDGGRCQRCGSQELLQFDHIIPVALGGSSEPDNLQLLCAPCNREKSANI